MKHFFLALSVCTVISVTANAQAKPKAAYVKASPTVKAVAISDSTKKTIAAPSFLKTNLDSFSYALGVNIANNLKAQSIEKINNAMMTKAMDDVFKKRPIAMSEQQCNGTIQAAIQGNSAKKSGSEKAKAKIFLANNKKRKEVITLPDGLQYEILKKGDSTSIMPSLQDTVVAHYAGTLINGKKFDNSYDRGQPLTIPVNGVIKGWTEILQMMHIGDKYKVYIPSELGYGERGAGADIPGGAALIFEMELLDVKVAAKHIIEAPASPAEEKKN